MTAVVVNAVTECVHFLVRLIPKQAGVAGVVFELSCVSKPKTETQTVYNTVVENGFPMA